MAPQATPLRPICLAVRANQPTTPIMMMISSMCFPVSAAVERRGAGGPSFPTGRFINSGKGAQFRESCARRDRAATEGAASAPLALGMARVAALVLPPRVGDRRLGALRLDAERRDQRILGVDDVVAGLAVELVTDRKFHRRSSLLQGR